MIIKNYIKTIIVSSLILSFSSFVYAWIEPSGNPPTLNTAPPLTRTSGGFGYGPAWDFHSLSSNSNGWLYLGDQNKNVYGGRGLAVGNFWTSNNAYFAEGNGIWNSAGNVGIGTAVPNKKLEIKGDHNTTQARLFSDHYSQGLDGANTAIMSLWASEPGWTWSGVGIGNNINGSPYYGRVTSTRGGSWARFLDNAISLHTVNSLGADLGGIEINNGNVGIGAAVPNAKLDVAGDIRAGNSDLYFTKTDHNHTGIGNTAGYAAIENAANYDSLMILGRAGTDKGRKVKLWDYLQVNGGMDVTGNVGIGTATSRANLDVQGTVSTTGDFYSKTAYNYWGSGYSDTNSIIFNNSGNGGDTGASINSYYWHSPSSSGWFPRPETRGMELKFSTAKAYRSLWSPYNWSSGAPVERMRITSDGRVGIGTVNPQATLDINGTIRGATYGFGGMFVENWEGDYSGYSLGACHRGNPFTGGNCSCPPGFSKSEGFWNGKYSYSADFYCYK